MNQSVSMHLRLREERERLGLSQTEFGKIGGVTKKTQMLYESGERSPDMVYLAAVAEAGVDILYVVTGERSRPVPPKYVAPPDEEWLMDAYRFSSEEGKKIILGATKAAALAARESMPASVRRKTS